MVRGGQSMIRICPSWHHMASKSRHHMGSVPMWCLLLMAIWCLLLLAIWCQQAAAHVMFTICWCGEGARAGRANRQSPTRHSSYTSGAHPNLADFSTIYYVWRILDNATTINGIIWMSKFNFNLTYLSKVTQPAEWEGWPYILGWYH